MIVICVVNIITSTLYELIDLRRVDYEHILNVLIDFHLLHLFALEEILGFFRELIVFCYILFLFLYEFLNVHVYLFVLGYVENVIVFVETRTIVWFHYKFFLHIVEFFHSFLDVLFCEWILVSGHFVLVFLHIDLFFFQFLYDVFLELLYKLYRCFFHELLYLFFRNEVFKLLHEFFLEYFKFLHDLIKLLFNQYDLLFNYLFFFYYYQYFFLDNLYVLFYF